MKAIGKEDRGMLQDAKIWAAWKRWKRENLTALGERHNMANKAKKFKINVEDVIMIKGNNKKQGTWKMGIIQKMYRGKDQVIRTVRIISLKEYLERPIQLLYHLELSCNDDSNINKSKDHQPIDVSNENNRIKMNINAPKFKPKRTVATIALMKIKNVGKNESKRN